MSWNPTLAPDCPGATGLDSIETLIIPRARDLGGFEVRRALPSPKRQMVGPFIFFDQMGPAEFLTEQGIDVRPHPHIGLGTVTYLYQGEFQHRDSLGTNQMIHPGAVNWMLAGRGVTHSERTSPDTRARGHNLFGIQTWVALPEDREDMAPAFEHHAKEALPIIEDTGVQTRLILGTGWGARAPVTMQSEIFYADVVLAPGAALAQDEELAARVARLEALVIEQQRRIEAQEALLNERAAMAPPSVDPRWQVQTDASQQFTADFVAAHYAPQKVA